VYAISTLATYHGVRLRVGGIVMNSRSVAISSLLGGLVIAVLSNIPVVNLANCIACMWVWAGGIFAAWYYHRSEGSITTGQGAVVGVLSGLIAAVISAIIGLVFGAFGLGLAALSGAQIETLEEVVGSTAASFLLAGGVTIIGLIINVFFYSIFGALSGLISAAFLERREAKV
jgi:hypothetical protein